MAFQQVFEKCLSVLEETRKVDWEVRERALIRLQQVFETVDEKTIDSLSVDIVSLLRRPLESQLKDLRSAIVRETCKLILLCQEKLTSKFIKTALYLTTPLLEVLSCGNKVISTYCDQCLLDLFLNPRMSPGLPRLLSLLTTSKNKDTRDLCISYLLVALENWSVKALSKHAYLLEDCLLQLVRDGSERVRCESRSCAIAFREHFPENYASLLLRVDERTYRALEKAIQNVNVKPKAQLRRTSFRSTTSSTEFRNPTSEFRNTTPSREFRNTTPSGEYRNTTPSSDFASSASSSPIQNEPNGLEDFSRLITIHRSRLNTMFSKLGQELELLKENEHLESDAKNGGGTDKTIVDEYEKQIRKLIGETTRKNEEFLNSI